MPFYLIQNTGGHFLNYSSKSHYFNDFIVQNGLLDLGYIGINFTWCNNQAGLARRHARLDRFLANVPWISNFSSYLTITY